jgi:hypothetical protein
MGFHEMKHLVKLKIKKLTFLVKMANGLLIKWNIVCWLINSLPTYPPTYLPTYYVPTSYFPPTILQPTY